jgi:acetyltransferase-like isoleucine patch superfamily enzyme
MPGATIGAGALVQDTIVGTRATIGARAELTGGTVVGDHEDVRDGAVLVGARVPEED